MSDCIKVSAQFYETYSWEPKDQMDVVRHVIYDIDNQRMHEIADHFKCDLSEIREWLEMKKKHGTWIGGELGHCSFCGHEGCASDIWDDGNIGFCPYCGADLRGES